MLEQQLAVTTTGVEGPDMSDLADVIRLKFEYDRSGVTDVHYNPIIEKSDFAGLAEASAYKLQGRGAAGAAFELYESNDKFYIKHPTAYTNVTLQIQNSQGGNTGPAGPPVQAQTQQHVPQPQPHERLQSPLCLLPAAQ